MDEIKKVETPGIGIAGMVMCPLLKSPCFKGGCEWWVEMVSNGTTVARCSMAWMSLLSTEIRASIDKLKKEL